MPKEYYSPQGVYEPIGWSHAVKAGNTIYVAGMLGCDENQKLVEGGFEAQTVKAFDNIGRVLAASGVSLRDVVKMNIYFKDLEDVYKFREIRARYFQPPMPVSTGVEVSRLVFDALVEIDVIAVKD
ncbi:MAG: RidA family protein [Candidatus Adiutricales bacterium]